MFSVKVRREEKISAVISDAELERTLAQINTKSVMGKRDMAMILLGVSTGMRACDIVNLKLSDIDWLRGELHLVQKKTANPVVLPLMQDVGEALKEYILNTRPDINSEYVFLTTQYPIRKLAEGTCLGFIFKKYEDNLQSTREMVSDFGILPMPKYDEQQEDYMNCPASFRMLTITIPVTNTRLELTGSVLEALSYYSKDTTVEAYYDANLQRKVSRDDESRHVLEIIFSTVTYDLIETYRWGDIFNIVCSNVEDPSSFVSQYTSGEPAMVADMEKTYTYFAGNQS